MQLIQKSDTEGTTGVSKFCQEARNFYVHTLKYMKKKFPLKNRLIQHAVVVDPAARDSASLQSLIALVGELPGVVPEDSQDGLCMEFLHYQSVSRSDLPAYDQPHSGRVDVFWAAMATLKDPATDGPMYPTLCSLAKHVLLVPHSNAYCETLFSMVKKVTTAQRSQLRRDKEGHACDSVYADAHGMRNTPCALLASKINIFKNTNCHSREPSDALSKKAKSATYQGLKYWTGPQGARTSIASIH